VPCCTVAAAGPTTVGAVFAARSAGLYALGSNDCGVSDGCAAQLLSDSTWEALQSNVDEGFPVACAEVSDGSRCAVATSADVQLASVHHEVCMYVVCMLRAVRDWGFASRAGRLAVGFCSVGMLRACPCFCCCVRQMLRRLGYPLAQLDGRSRYANQVDDALDAIEVVQANDLLDPKLQLSKWTLAPTNANAKYLHTSLTSVGSRWSRDKKRGSTAVQGLM